MKKIRKDALLTCQNLIEAASVTFAEKGYRDATVAEICRKAHTNVASVNYHFGDKETLYRKSWRYSFRECLKKYPPDGGVSEDAKPEERLKGRIVSLVSKMLDKDLKAFSILQKELARPTGLLKLLVDKEVQPLQEKMTELVRELIGKEVSEERVQACKTSILGQCFHVLMMKQITVNIHDFANNICFDNVDAISTHIFKFSLAGIKAIREEGLSR